MKYIWLLIGWICVVMGYIGFVTPGIPFSIFIVGAAYCFAKSSPRMHRWLYSHKWFGPFLENWTEKQIFPTKMKYAMVTVMSSSLAFLWFTTYNAVATFWSGVFMVLVSIWAWRFPGSVEEHDERVKNGKKIGWIR